MKKKNAKTKEASRPPLPDPGYYGAHVGSPQNVEFGKFTNSNYLKPAQERAEMVVKMREVGNFDSEKLRTFAEYQGQSTFNFRRRKTDITPLSKPSI